MEISREGAVWIAMSTYLGESCRFCGKEITTMEELKTVVYAGYHDKGRIAHRECWDAQSKEVISEIQKQCEADRASAPKSHVSDA